MESMRSFGSDNNSGVHPRIMKAIVESNTNHAIGYGDDDWTRKAEKAMQTLLITTYLPYWSTSILE